MSRVAPDPFHAALDAAVSGRRKLIAGRVWPKARDPESKLSRVLSGELNPPPRLMEEALCGLQGAPLLEHMRLCHLANPSELRQVAIREIAEGRATLDRAIARLDQADDVEDRERKGPIRVEPRPSERRRRA